MHPTGGGKGIRIRFVKKIKNEYPLLGARYFPAKIGEDLPSGINY